MTATTSRSARSRRGRSCATPRSSGRGCRPSSEAAATIGAAQIQNRGTIGGNICNASPAGDSLPVLLAVDATFDVGSAAGQRSIPAREFWTGLSADGAAAG